MPPPAPARLQSAALQLAASFDHMFPDGASRLVVWEFIAVGCWRQDVKEDGPFGWPMGRWGAFLRHRDRYPLFELLLEDVVGLKDVTLSLWQCRQALRLAVRSSPRPSREVMLYADLFRRLKQSRWAEDEGVESEPTAHQLFDDALVCRVRVRPPNVALVREMARVGGEWSTRTPTVEESDAVSGGTLGRGGRPPNPQLPQWKAEAKRVRDQGMSYRDVAGHIRETFDVARSPETIEAWVKELRRLRVRGRR